MSETGPTLAQIASAAGVSRMMVSRALRNAPYVDPEKRALILRLAEELGYRPDPKLSAFMHYLRHRRSTGRAETLAYVFCRPDRRPVIKSLSQLRFLRGIEFRADQLGFRLDHFDLGPGALSPKRLAQILATRGIRGAVIANLAVLPVSIEPALQSIACCVAGRVQPELPVHRASSSHYACIRLALARLRERGHGRIGLFLNQRTDAHLQHAWRAAMRDFLWENNQRDDRLIHLVPEWDRSDFLAWVREVQPTVIVSHHELAWTWLQEAGLAPNIPLVLLDRPPGKHPLSGIDQQYEAIGSAAVDLIAAHLLNHDVGPPAHPQLVSIAGTWVEGDGATSN